LEQMKQLPDNSVDSIVTDPPYGISFMAKKWDYDVPKVEVWKEAMRVLKHGGHALIACGTRTQHRMVVNIEDAGFEIRDVVSWIYGSGFPKSLNISKAIDKMPKASVSGFSAALKARRVELGLSVSAADQLITNGTTMYSFLEGRGDGDPYPPNREHWEKIKEHFGMEGWEGIVENSLNVVGKEGGNFGYQKSGERWKNPSNKTEHTTDEAKQWDGWGTALKPSCEFFTLCRKPLSEKTIAKNVLKWGTGGINIDGCRVGTETIKTCAKKEMYGTSSRAKDQEQGFRPRKFDNRNCPESTHQGRFPANLIHDGSQQVLELFPETNKDSAARFFYCPKASKKDRDEGNNHPTVKPTALMQYLCRLITPTGGVVLDPYMGSGSTGKAAVKEGFSFVGCELDEDYYKIAMARIEAAK